MTAPDFVQIRLPPVKAKWPLRPRGSTLHLLLAARRAESNIAPIMTAIEMNARRGGISAVPRVRDGCSKGGHRQNPSAGGHNLAVHDFCSGVKNLNAFQIRDVIQTGNYFPGFV